MASKENLAGSGVNRPMIIIGALFFIFGFITWLSSVLIPYLKIACELNNFESYLVVFSFYISYLIMAIPSAKVLEITGFKKGMSIGLILMAVGALVFIPAALARTYGMFLFGLFIMGSGMAILQTASNPYVTILGPRESAAKRISIMGICNGIAGAMAPIILGAVILDDSDALVKKLSTLSPAAKSVELDLLAERVIVPYLVMAGILLVLALMVYFSGLPEVDAEDEDEAGSGANTHKTSIFHFPHLLLGVFTLFLYVGVEVIAGDTIINFGHSQGIEMSTAKFFTSLTLTGMLVGYVIGIISIPRYFSQEQALKFCAILGICFALGALSTTGYVAVLFIALLGLANSLMWPAIWPLALAGLGRFTKIGSSLLIMAIGGGAVLPLLYGRLADVFTPHYAYWMVVPVYVVILFYAVYGHKIGQKVKTPVPVVVE